MRRTSRARTKKCPPFRASAVVDAKHRSRGGATAATGVAMEDTTSQIGLNHRLSVANSYKQQTRALYEGALGATVTPPRPGVEIFTFTNGSGIGVFYVAPSQALTPEQHLKAIWLEFEVEDEQAAAADWKRLECARSTISIRCTSIFKRPADKSSVSRSARASRFDRIGMRSRFRRWRISFSQNRYPLFRDMRQPGLTPQKLSGLVSFARHCSRNEHQTARPT